MDKRDDKGRFAPGCSSNGRPKGSRNKAGQEIKKKVEDLLSCYSLEQMKTDLLELEPNERLKLIPHFMEFVLPKLNRVDQTHMLEGGAIVVKLPVIAEDTEFTDIPGKEDNEQKQIEK